MVLLGCYGYAYDSKKQELSIIEDEAKVVRYIFKRYIAGDGCKTIATQLTKKEILSPTGKSYWSAASILDMLKNEKYVGDILQGKTYGVDVLTHKRRENRGEEDKYYMKNHHQGIVSREDFEKVAEIRKSKNHSMMISKAASSRYTFSGTIKCGFCGGNCGRRKAGRKHPAWGCTVVYKQARIFCEESRDVREFILEGAFMEAYHLLTANDGLAIENFMNLLKESSQDQATLKLRDKIEDDRKSYKTKMSKLLDLYVDEKIDTASFDKKQNSLKSKINECDKKLEEINNIIAEDSNLEKNLIKVKEKLLVTKGRNLFNEFNSEIYKAMVKYVIIGGYDEEGVKDPYMIRFICNKDLKSDTLEIPKTMILSNNNLKNKETSIYLTILDFYYNKDFITFEEVNGIRKKCTIDKTRVRVEVER